MFIISSLYEWIQTDEPTGPTGADAIRTAVQEYQDLSERDFTAILGEPEVLRQGGEFFNEPKVVVPIEDGPFDESQRLFFDLPHDVNDDESQFTQLLELFGLTFETMEEVAGQEAPVTFIGGNILVDWDVMKQAESSDKGGETQDAGGVNVEETTVSAETADD